jgi:hypothetical protein
LIITTGKAFLKLIQCSTGNRLQLDLKIKNLYNDKKGGKFCGMGFGRGKFWGWDLGESDN